MRILHVFDHSLPLHSGYSFRSLALLKEQRRRGWETAHLTTPRHTLAGSDPEQVEGLEFRRTPPPTGVVARVPLVSLLAEIRSTSRRLREIADSFRPDLIHAHSPVLNALAAAPVAQDLRIPLVYEIRGTWEDAAVANKTSTEGSAQYRLTRLLETYAARHADAVGVICDGLRREFLHRGVPDSRLFLTPNAVDVDQFTPLTSRDAALESQLGLAGTSVIGFLGSFYDYEGLDCLVSAFANIASRRPDTRLLLVGGGPCETSLKAQVKAAGLGDRVVMSGRVPQRDVDRYYSLVDILAYPRKRTRVTELVTPLKPLEGMALSKLVVASDVGGHRELIRPGETGELFAADDHLALAEVLDRMLSCRADWPRYHQSGLDYVRRERTWVRTVDNYVSAYRSVLERARH